MKLMKMIVNILLEKSFLIHGRAKMACTYICKNYVTDVCML
jgi:hypothetical protein